MNLLDKTIAAVSPAWAARRQKARMQLGAAQALSGLHAPDNGAAQASAVKVPPWRPAARDARSDSLRRLPLQRAQSRQLARTSALACGAINTNVERVVGTGLALVAQPAVETLLWSPEQGFAWKTQVQREFSLWADSTDCDLEGLLNFYQLQALVLRSVLESGDCFTLMPDGAASARQPYRLRLQVLEADRVGNPQGLPDAERIAAGVRFDAHGMPEAYHVYDRHPGAGMAGGDLHAGRWIERAGSSGRVRILHHYRKLRPGLPRGVPYLAPVIDCIKQMARYSEAEITAAVVTSYLTVFIETADGQLPPPFGPVKGDDASATSSSAAAQPPSIREVALGTGTVVGLYPGEKPHLLNPVRPNPNFEAFTLAVTRQIGIALGLPYELLVKQFNASYSASKAALLDAWVYCRSVRYWLSLSFCQPVYETWLTEAVARSRVNAPGFFEDAALRWAYTPPARPGRATAWDPSTPRTKWPPTAQPLTRA